MVKEKMAMVMAIEEPMGMVRATEERMVMVMGIEEPMGMVSREMVMIIMMDLHNKLQIYYCYHYNLKYHCYCLLAKYLNQMSKNNFYW